MNRETRDRRVFLRKRTPSERALRAVERLETAADSLMRLGDTSNAISLYALALELRMGEQIGEENHAVT